MPPKKPPPAGSAIPPYPVSPVTGHRAPAVIGADDPYAESLLDSPAFNLRELGQVLTPSNRPSSAGPPAAGLPDSLRVGPVRRKSMGEATPKPSSEDLRKGYQKGEVPELLRPGAGKKSAETQRPATTPLAAGSAGPSAPPPMAANIAETDRPFSEYSPFYTPPPQPAAPAPDPPQPATTLQPPSVDAAKVTPQQRPPPIVTASSSSSVNRSRGDSVASTISSAGFDPGADLSSFDASYARAYPGRRGAPAVGMEGWKEDAEGEANARTWEEDVDRRVRAGAELQRRTEEAALREREEALQAEYWEQEKREAVPVPGPSRPPKEDGNVSPVSPISEAADEERGPAPLRAPPAAGLPPVQEVNNQRSQRPPAVDPATEIYQIKHVNLLPPTSAQLHKVPILLQNANGPCPLLALVNAITLSTPPGAKSALLETLRLREQVSLNLLLQSVFEELMTRGADLPDVGDLFAFLMTLHTGMNVNPRFVDITPATVGAFEDTKELRLYAAFMIPLVHGWIPSPDAPVTAALTRSAKTYEETQTLLIAEEDLISRLTSSSADPTLAPSPAESALLEDAALIREFVESTATQLTPFGLHALRTHLPEGKVAILFRNDHFSTILRRADGELVALVTDMGFAGHDEVVWESLADVSGRDNRFLSGDFRPIGGAVDHPEPVHPPRLPPRNSPEHTASVPAPPPPPPEGHPDVDYDLALAMHLQEEEDAREHAREEARRRRERPDLPPRRHGGGRGEVPPPPYEPPPPRGSGAAPASSASAEGGTWQVQTGRRRSGHRRGASAGVAPPVAAGGAGAKEEKEKCVVM